MFAYASGDAFTEMLVPCTWYVLPLAASVAQEQEKGWAPLGLEAFKARAGKIFWRGSPNDFLHYTKENFRFAPRVKLVEQGMRHPELLDVQLTSCECAGRGFVCVYIYVCVCLCVWPACFLVCVFWGWGGGVGGTPNP
jgi:hypothetical protein